MLFVDIQWIYHNRAVIVENRLDDCIGKCFFMCVCVCVQFNSIEQTVENDKFKNQAEYAAKTGGLTT